MFLLGVKDDKMIQTGFCIKGVTQVSNYDMDWPKGDYCILKYGNQCPVGKLNDFNKQSTKIMMKSKNGMDTSTKKQ